MCSRCTVVPTSAACCCSTEHGPGNEAGILWNDPALGIAWPEIPPLVSEKDREAPTLAQWLYDPRSQHFRHS